MMKSKLTIVKKYAVLMMTVIVCLCMQPFAMTVQASQPKVMVVDCKIVQKEIIFGGASKRRGEHIYIQAPGC